MWGGPILGRGQLATEGECKGLQPELWRAHCSCCKRLSPPCFACCDQQRAPCRLLVRAKEAIRALEQHASLQLTCCSPHYTHVQSCRRWP